jgi:predicted ATPase
VARYLDEVGSRSADFLSYSHGEGFLRLFEERCQRQGTFIFDEPESALSPSRQMEFLKLMRRMETMGTCQIIVATYSPILMAYPGAHLLRLTKYGLDPVRIEQTDHFRVMREFCHDPKGFVEAVIEESTPAPGDKHGLKIQQDHQHAGAVSAADLARPVPHR